MCKGGSTGPRGLRSTPVPRLRRSIAGPKPRNAGRFHARTGRIADSVIADNAGLSCLEASENEDPRYFAIQSFGIILSVGGLPASRPECVFTLFWCC